MENMENTGDNYYELNPLYRFGEQPHWGFIVRAPHRNPDTESIAHLATLTGRVHLPDRHPAQIYDSDTRIELMYGERVIWDSRNGEDMRDVTGGSKPVFAYEEIESDEHGVRVHLSKEIDEAHKDLIQHLLIRYIEDALYWAVSAKTYFESVHTSRRAQSELIEKITFGKKTYMPGIPEDLVHIYSGGGTPEAYKRATCIIARSGEAGQKAEELYRLLTDIENISAIVLRFMSNEYAEARPRNADIAQLMAECGVDVFVKSYLDGVPLADILA